MRGERLSSEWTGLHKIVPGFIGAVTAVNGVGLALYAGFEPAAVAFLFCVMSLFFFSWMRRLRNVNLLGDCLVVEQRGVSRHVHISQIARVSQSHFLRPPVVTLTLKEPGPVGATVEFIPKGMIIHSLDDGPVTLRLRELAENVLPADCAHGHRGAT
jgi:hypothetical protein